MCCSGLSTCNPQTPSAVITFSPLFVAVYSGQHTATKCPAPSTEPKRSPGKILLFSVITVPFLLATVLFCYLWVYTPYVYNLDLERVKGFPLSNTETVESRIAAINGLKKVTWISGEFFPCAAVDLKNSDEVNFCFVISRGKLYAKNEKTVEYFPELKISGNTMH